MSYICAKKSFKYILITKFVQTLKDSETLKPLKPKLSNPMKMFTIFLSIAIIYCIHLFVLINQNDNLESLGDLNNKIGIENFFYIAVIDMLFSVIGIMLLSLYLSMMDGYLSQLDSIFIIDDDKLKDEKDVLQAKTNERVEWQNSFLNDLNSSKYYYILIPAFLLTCIIHYLVLGKEIINNLGFIAWILNLVLVFFPITFLIINVIWLAFAEYFHIFQFNKSYEENDNVQLFIGESIDRKSVKFANLFRNLLPINTSEKQIKIDLLREDKMGGLAPLSKMILMGTYFVAIIAAITSPVFILEYQSGENEFSVLMIPLFTLGLLLNYFIGSRELKNILKFEKKVQLDRLNYLIDQTTTKIFDQRTQKEGSSLKILLDDFKVYEEIRNRIYLTTNPNSSSNLIKVIFSSSLPIMTFLIDSNNLIDTIKWFENIINS